MLRNIVVGLSGGVDSAVTALLLKRKGYNVTGVFIKNWDIIDETGECLAENEFEDANWVAKKLSIPLVRVDFVKEYWNDVFSYLLESYQNGNTPNPDIKCDSKIKFGSFYQFARDNLKADAVATGHYARTSFGPYLEHYKPNTKVKLLQGLDPDKDQTFFMSQVDQEPLQRCMFPLGEYYKRDVKKIAAEAQLDIVLRKKESMGICFIGLRNFQHFISEYVENKPGNFVDLATGSVVGKHEGIHHWTLGQRCRIPGGPTKYFIFQKDVQTNDILVVPGTDHPALYTQLIIASKPHWICDEPEEFKKGHILHCSFRFQHRRPLSSAVVYKSSKNKLIIHVAEPQRAVTPGQFAVLYKDEECLGSATILYPGPSLYSLQQILPLSMKTKIETMQNMKYN